MKPMTNIEISLMIDAEIARRQIEVAAFDSLPTTSASAGPCVDCGLEMVRAPHPVPEDCRRFKCLQRCHGCYRRYRTATR